MKQLQRHLSLLAVLVFALGIVAVVPVSAQTERGGAGAADNPGSERRAAAQQRLEEAKERAIAREEDRAMAFGDNRENGNIPADIQNRVKVLLAEKRQNAEEKSQEARQKACEARKSAFDKRTENYNAHAKRHLEVFDSIYDKVEAYQVEKNIILANYDELKEAVEAKRGEVITAVEALGSVSGGLDCTAEDPAAAVASLKEAVADVRESLHAYRTAIKDLVVALNTAATENAGEETVVEGSAEEAEEN